VTRNHRLRFLDNNLNDSATATITYSSQASSTYAAANTRDPSRSKYWTPAGALATEYYQLDLGVAYPVTAFAMIGPIDEAFQLNEYASIVVKADNIDDTTNWTSPAFSQTVTAEARGGGAFAFFDVASGTQPSYRYWRVEFDMGDAPDLKVSHIYFGDYVTLTVGNIAPGFTLGLEDPSEVFQAESGQKFFNSRPKYRTFSSAEVQIMEASFKREVEEMAYRLGKTETLYVSLDPTGEVSATAGELTMYGRFANPPELRHVFGSYYSLAFSFEEAV
jgi:hypothetical protein